MDLLEKISRSFGSWYEGLFGGSEDIRPKDILRRLISVLEDNRKEGIDNKTYVPNQYLIDIHVTDSEEREYLLSFLDKVELEQAIRRYCQQNKYQIRGALEVVITDTTAKAEGDEAQEEEVRNPPKLRIRCRYTKTEPTAVSPNAPTIPLEPSAEASPFEEQRTIVNLRAALEVAENATVPGRVYGNLTVYPLNGSPYPFPIYQAGISIGRSTKTGNDLLLEGDGQISKRHAKLERDTDGSFILYDLGSTNGTRVNGALVDNRILQSGDEIMIGKTRIIYEQGASASKLADVPQERKESPRLGGVFGGAAAPFMNEGTSSPPMRQLRPQTARLVKLNEQGEPEEKFSLASETLLGRGITNDIVLPDRSVSTRHACIISDGAAYTVEALADANTTLNGIALEMRQPIRLTDGDTIEVGNVTLRFESKASD